MDTLKVIMSKTIFPMLQGDFQAIVNDFTKNVNIKKIANLKKYN